MTEPWVVVPLERPPDATVRVPGSRSFTNRALVAAALAAGRSTITGALHADDTEAMVESLGRLRATIACDPEAATIEVDGLGGAVPDGSFDLDARLSGTTSRFLLPLLALGPGHYRLDGEEPLRRRPMQGSLDALRSLGASIEEAATPGHLPVTVQGPVAGGVVGVPGDTSSQFLSGLLLAAPGMAQGLRLALTTDLVGRPFVDMTVATMRAFGADVTTPDRSTFVVAPTPYRATTYAVEPDAGSAGYFFAAAALTGGRVRVDGLGPDSIQGDLELLDVLAAMGADVERGEQHVEVRGTGRLAGGRFDLAHLPDTALTVAALAPFASSPVEVTGVGFIRGHESDRIAVIVNELGRCGVAVRETDDGFVVEPGAVGPATIETYHDHRVAMSFALLGLRVPGIAISDPDCVAKTFPDYFAVLDQLRSRP